MKKTTIAYWVFTILFAFPMFSSGVMHIMSNQQSIQGFGELGLPAYLLPFLGWAKVLGVVAILVPGYPRIKEWAYAGLQFDMIGAIYCIAAIGKPLIMWSPLLIIVLVGALSYYFYHKRLQQSPVGRSAVAMAAS